VIVAAWRRRDTPRDATIDGASAEVQGLGILVKQRISMPMESNP
jgi:hypothetical protein